MHANITIGVARETVTFLHIPEHRTVRAVRCVCFMRESGCVVVLPDGFRRGNWNRFRIGGRIFPAVGEQRP